LKETFGIVFNRLYTIINQPVARFAEDLRRQGKWDQCLELMAGSFNPAIVRGLMCRRILNVDYRGELYDCDFNQMLRLRMTRADKPALYLWDLTPEWLEQRPIQTGFHRLACMAGNGSSCTGALSGAGHTQNVVHRAWASDLAEMMRS